MIPVPAHICKLLQTLEDAGRPAYIVGGCVRDALRTMVPSDYDVATAATPNVVKSLFPHTADTGIHHGTVTVILDEGIVEVTTFRTENGYHDCRRPDAVTFVRDIEADLSRRDFTINAMAYSPQRGFADPFDGRTDLHNRCIRAVGTPKRRFEEDALRILRCVRFAATLGFTIEPATERAMVECVPRLQYISRERILTELNKTLQYADDTIYTLLEQSGMRETILPLVRPFSDTAIKNAVHCQTLAAKWAHLCGMATAQTLKTLKSNSALCQSAAELAAYKPSGNILLDIAHLRHASPTELLDYIGDAEATAHYENAKKSHTPLSVSALPIDGNDLQNMGLRGREIGTALEWLLLYAIENPGNTTTEQLKEAIIWKYQKEN